MKSYLPILLAVLPALLLCTEHASAVEICPQENCLTPDKCEELVRGDRMCHAQGTSCCSIVKEEHRTHCNHFQGICMEKCGAKLQRDAVDCPGGQVCCVLV